MKVSFDRELCIGAASCVAIASKTFALDDEAKVKFVNDEEPQGDDDDTVLEAAKSCPVKAIFIDDDEGKRIWPQ